MRLWPLTLLRPRRWPPPAEPRQRILPLDERADELLRRHRATREIDGGKP